MIRKLLHRLDPSSSTWLSSGLAVLGGVIYLIQSRIYIHTQASILDEGAYLVLGRMFVNGRYRPFQDYGPWTNQMPLSFIIPGFVQASIESGLRSGRYFAISLGILMLVGIWIAARRLGGDWWGAGAVLIIAGNPAIVKMYSIADSQVLAACLLAWIMVFTLGEGRSLWQLVLASILAGLVVLTRVNLIPVLPFVIGYIFWQHGSRKGLAATITGGAVLLIGHGFFWPGILRMWAAWIPSWLAPFLSPWRAPTGLPLWNPEVGLDGRLLSLLFGFRYHFVAVVGVITLLLLWPAGEDWRRRSDFKASVFLVSLFLVLYLAHAWATLGVNTQTYEALGRNYCVYCFPVYLAFFSFLGLLAMAGSMSAWRKQPGVLIRTLAIGLILGLSAAIGYSAFDPVGDMMLSWRIPRMMTFLKSGQLLPGYVPLWEFLQNKVGLVYNQSRRLIPATAGFGIGILVLGATLALKYLASQRAMIRNRAFASQALMVFLVFGWMATPTIVMGAGYQDYDCGWDVIASFERSGEYLSLRIPASAKLYWQGGLSAIPLLYLPTEEIFPAQIQMGYTFRLSGDTDQLRKYGFWNQELADQWLSESDFVLVEGRFYRDGLKERLENANEFELVGLSPPTVPCREDARIYIFRNRR